MARQSLMSQMKEATKPQSSGFNDDLWNPAVALDLNKSSLHRLVRWEDPVSHGLWTIKKQMKAYFTNPDNDDEVWTVYIPCLEMYEAEEKCPVAAIVRDYYKQAKELTDGGSSAGEVMKNAATTHWIKYNYFFQGFVLSGGVEDTDSNTLVPFMYPRTLYTMIYDSIHADDTEFKTLVSGEYTDDDIALALAGETDPDLTEQEFEALFTGTPIQVKKTKKGEHNNYETSQWARDDQTLTPEQIQHISDEGYIDLRKFLPTRPTAEQYAAYVEMMKISMAAALGNDDNTWRPEWDALGIKPSKPKGSASTSSNEGGGSDLKDRLAAKRSGNSSGSASTDGGASITDKLSRGRSKPAAEAEAETPVEAEAEAKPAAKPSLAERLAAAKAKAEEANS